MASGEGKSLQVEAVAPAPDCPIRFQTAPESLRILDPGIPETADDFRAGKVNYQLEFKNEAKKPIVEVAISYEAWRENTVTRKTFSLKLSSPVLPGEARTLSFWAAPVLPRSSSADTYRLRARRIQFKDGTTWREKAGPSSPDGAQETPPSSP